ncbi:indolepyruvate ferredoxin oxidoreductase family protein [Marinobacter segnicrescens]|uniref:indolepyruvate ferredoxin oxidoreductase family protein n=1 Tax=Marinobacter segnicrescens TaxID=430453 RepID=UPI003A8D497A
MVARNVSLDDKFTSRDGRIYLSGTQALVRLLLIQKQRDLDAGLNTGGLVSGYRGSPLGGVDKAMWGAASYLSQGNIRFQPGLNEELAATTLWGTQQVQLSPEHKVDGVFGMWYGKGPGVDRAMDAFKHANSAGTSALGGVLLVAGDDHAAESSTLVNQSDQLLMGAMIPVLNPATVQDYLDFGVFGYGLSRYSGCWVGFKAIAETVETSASVDASFDRVNLVEPDFEKPEGGLNLRWPDPILEQERRLHGPRMDAVAAFARANPIDRIELDAPNARLGIMTTGKAYLDVVQALKDLGIDEKEAARLGIRLYKVGLSWPLETEGARAFASGLQDILVVEEKRSFIEDQLVRALYNLDAANRPPVVGKVLENGQKLLPSEGELTPLLVAKAIVSRLERMGAEVNRYQERIAALDNSKSLRGIAVPSHARTPYFCSGCPHNTSTRVPEGSRSLAGIGCHIMVMFMPSRGAPTFTQMGGEGANWIGQAPFTSEKHVFQNLGDGTYAHSGTLAIRAAVAAGVNITYKILYNDAVAMTGGQKAEGGFTVGDIVRQMLAEGVRRVVVVSDDIEKYPPHAFPDSVDIFHRDQLDSVQKTLREESGVTVLIYDQTCAAEKRRRRKRGLMEDPPRRVFINESVCEGCGDCSEQSNCISVKPLETEFGRKRQIDQASCNKDFSCVKGFCPSFVTVEGGKLRTGSRREPASRMLKDIPLPEVPALADTCSILVTGIGGTGVLTLGGLLGMAAHLEGKGCSVLDNTGAAQKNGAVSTHVRITADPDSRHAVRITAGAADVILGCDMVVATSPPVLETMVPGKTRAVVNTDLQPTAAHVQDPDLAFDYAGMEKALTKSLGEDGLHLVAASELAADIFGNPVATNVLMLGVAFQKGLIPLQLESLEQAIELNGVDPELNKEILATGRLLAFDPDTLCPSALNREPAQPKLVVGEMPSVDELIERRTEQLVAYQGGRYARKYRDFLVHIREQEAGKVPGGAVGLTLAVAENLYKLMAYKDEYEVARLYTNGEFMERVNQRFEGDFTLRFHLAPPLLARKDKETGKPRKMSFGPWVLPVFRTLAALRWLRGTPLDPFGYTRERKVERRLIRDYQETLGTILQSLSPENHQVAILIANVPGQIRGYGHIKQRNLDRAMDEQEALMQKYLHASDDKRIPLAESA